MSSRIENLGDYNKVRIDLQNAGGNLDILYGKIGATAVAKAAPALLVAGAGIFYISQKGVQLFKILVVSIHPQGGEGLFLQPVEPVFLLGRIGPEAEVTANDNVVTPVHRFLSGQVPHTESLKISVTITGSKDHIYRSSPIVRSISMPPWR